MRKRILPVFAAVILVVVSSLSWAQPGSQYSPPYAMRLESSPLGPGYYIAGADTNIGNSFKLVSLTAFTQMPRVDTLRIRSSSTADSSNVTLYYVTTADSSVVYQTLRVSGTDTVFAKPDTIRATPSVALKTGRAMYLQAAVADTEMAGTLSVYSKTGGLLTTILPGHLQTYTAHYFTQKYAGSVLDSWGVQVDQNSPAIQIELRWYPDFKDALNTPETGFRVLDRRTIGGVRAVRTHSSKNIVAGDNDTSTIFFLSSLEKVGYFSVVTDVGTSVTAMSIDVSADTTNWKQTTAIDSTTGVNGTTQTRAESIPVDSLYGQPWGRLIVNNKGTTGDTATVSIYLTLKLQEDNRAASPPWGFPYPIRLTNTGYLAIYARSIGLTNGRINFAYMNVIDRQR